VKGDRQANRRIRLLLACFAVVFAIALGRAAWLQVVHAATLGRQAQRMHQETTTTPAGRGAILDRSGVPLAIGEQTTTIYADPHMVLDPRGVAIAAHRLLGVDANVLFPRLLKKDTHFLYVARFADPKAADAFLARKFTGVYSYPEERRAYPQNTVGSQVVGFAGTDNHGLGGLELEYDHQLAGAPGKQTVVRDPAGRAIDVLRSTPERDGRDVYTTIDHAIQANAEAVLRRTVTTWRARSATAIVIEPRTGAVLAMAQAPGYDANKATKVPYSDQRNRAVTDTYEPGSTFKLVTIAGALSAGIVTPQTKFKLNYSIHVADRVIHDAEFRHTEWMTVSEILSHSSNVGAVTIAEKLGSAALMDWIQRFGYGKLTGIGFPGESPGLVLPLDKWYGSTIGNVPIGQGIAVTPIQMAAAYAAIANGGVWVQPHLVDRVGGRVLRSFKHRRVVSPAIDAELKTMLTGVVDEHGATGTAAAIPGYSVAGKTGTAQVPGPHGYTTGQYVASFVGMVPVKKPRLVVLVVVNDPTRGIFGGTVAAPAFAEIAKFDLQYLNVPPDAPVGATTTGK
jgi:cell division protein FtsI (penicillin-binding protein 3)/stage V sporulation protein D (sporulation-specific penicillin-binding protein)